MRRVSSFFGSFGRYSDGRGGAARAQWLEAYDGGPQRIDRIRRGHVHVPNWSAVIAGNIQPRKLTNMGRNLIDDGLFQRFLTAHARPIGLGGDDDKPLATGIGAEYRQLHEALAALHPEFGSDGSPEVCSVDHDGLAERGSFMRLVERLRVDTTLPIIVRETAAKWSGLLGRLSLIFHLVDVAERSPLAINHIDPYRVSGASVAMAATFLRRIAVPNLFRLGFETMPDEGAPATHARWIAGHVLARGLDRITARAIGRAYRPLRGKPLDTVDAMAILVDGGWASPTTARHDSTEWIINAAVHTRFASAAAKERERRDQVIKAIHSPITDL